MKRYKVEVTYHNDFVLIVEAKNEQEAEAKADAALQEMNPWDMVALCEEGNNADELPEDVIEASADGGERDITRVEEEGYYPNGAYCLGCKRKFSRDDCISYGFGEGDQPDTCPSCGARIEPVLAQAL